ncbi:MAG: hypothetical protein V1867_08050 [Candidatus Falkowbacteria bacterium]
MFRAISGALSFLLILLVLRSALPEIYDLLVEIITKILSIANAGLDQMGQPI